MKPAKTCTPRAKPKPGDLQRRAFLAAYAVSGNLSRAAKAAKVARRSHYDWMTDPAYAAAFEDAREQAGEALEEEARRRAVTGTLKPVIYQGSLCREEVAERTESIDPETGEVTVKTEYKKIGKPLAIREYSDTLLIFLMKGAMPNKYRDNVQVTGANGGPIETSLNVTFVSAK
jgi:hypothetical protein